jgi:hypothetical protein
MRRREFITLIGGAAAALLSPPLSARAQQVGSLPRVVYLTGGAIDNQEIVARRAAFRLGFEKLGWIDGRNVRIDYHWGSDPPPQRREAFAAELMSSAPNVILISGTPMSKEFQRLTRMRATFRRFVGSLGDLLWRRGLAGSEPHETPDPRAPSLGFSLTAARYFTERARHRQHNGLAAVLSPEQPE